ncbi:MAG: tetratricopeptide repeat protein [Myxococcales bacterium]|nr:tetratricopeptide repeat protein [Myxococcales bacterium]
MGLLDPSWASALPREERWQPREGEPGSGAAREQAGAGDRSRLAEPARPVPKTIEEAEGIDEFERILARYKDASEAAQDTLRSVTVVEAAAGRAKLEAHYGAQIVAHKQKAAQLRATAIARYEEFLKQRPDSPTWTPEIMLRLAELHFEAESERYAELEKAYEAELARFLKEHGPNSEAKPPAPPTASYDQAVSLYRGVATRFPSYAHTDAALYMMGILLYESEDFDGSRQSFLALSCADKFPVPLADGSNVVAVESFQVGDYSSCAPAREGSKYIAEAWLRVGEIHYDVDEYDPAYEAYAAAAKDPDGPLYDEALIRMAWTLYLRREFKAAAERLDEFVLLVDRAKRARKAKEELGGAAELREDAIRYIAKCYVEDDWDLDGNKDKVAGFARLERDYKERTGEDHVPEIYAQLGELLAVDTQFRPAIHVWDTALRRWPLAPAAPLLQKKILDAYLALQDKPAALAAREALATHYLRGTKWFYKNESDPDVIEEAMKLVEEALVAVAVEQHALAQELRSRGDPQATEAYRKAARAYGAYLQRYPDSPNAYKYRFDMAESLFYSEAYLEAADAYAQVRDDNTGSKFQLEAARGVVFALEAHMQSEQDAKRLVLPDMPKRGQATGPFDPREIPELLTRLQDAYDRVIMLDPSPAKGEGEGEASGVSELATLRFNAAAISHRYYHFDDSQRRFEQILERHCDSNVAINAGFAIIDSYVVREDHKGTQQWTDKLAQLGCGEGAEKEKFAGDLKTLGLAARFAEANEYLEAGAYEAAADRYVALVAEDPKDENADRALNNAAVAYEKIGRFGSARDTYQRIYTEYPDSEFADDALLRTGLNHVRFFEFDEAVNAYLTLAESDRYKESEHRLLALKNAADLLENVQQYEKSSRLFKEYAGKAKDPGEAADATFRAAQVLRKTDDPKAVEAAFQQFVGKYGGAESQADKVVEAQLRIGQARAERGDRKGAEKAYRECIATFTARGLKAGTTAADHPSEAQFLLSEYALADLLEFKLKGRGKALEKSTKELFDRVVEASKAYDAVIPYRRLEWVLAAMYRRAYAFEITAIKMRKAPVPGVLKPYTEVWFAYKDLVEKGAQQFEAMALPLYEETVKRGKEYGVANEWTDKARERLNIYKPAEYPLLHDPAIELELEDRR